MARTDSPTADFPLEWRWNTTSVPLKWAPEDVDLAIGITPGDVPPLLGALSRQWHAAVAAGHGGEDISAARLALGRATVG